MTTNTADEQTIVNNLIETANSLASGLSARATEIRDYYVQGATTQKALIDAFLADMARSFREQAARAENYRNLTDASNLGLRSVYYSAYEYYAREAQRFQNAALDSKAQLNAFLEGTKAELSKFLNSEAIARLGPLFDAAQMITAVADDSVDRRWPNGYVRRPSQSRRSTFGPA